MSATFDTIRLAAIPDDLSGKTVLDVGGYSGQFARLCAQRGAASVLIVDNGEWQQYGWEAPDVDALVREGIDYAEMDFMEWRQPADFVVFYNVLYHCKDPMAALRHVRSLTRWQMALCTSFVDGRGWTYYPDGMGHPNGTVYCRPSIDGLNEALERVGFTQREEIGRVGDHVVIVCS